MSAPPSRVGIVVPCRNEAEVVERKLANLARLAWPPGARHRIVVVDDGSEDATAARAIARIEELFPPRPGSGGAPLAGDGAAVEAALVANCVRPGKPGAISTALQALGDEVDLVVLTDADVVVAPDALLALVEAFDSDPGLALASGAQRFVRDLAPDGSARGLDLGPTVPAGGVFDRATARVRALESRAGCLFSVHGQWLAWRASLALRPRLGLAADDLDLVLQVRARADAPRAVRLIARAVFHEEKTPRGPRADAQALRRARAWVQVLRASAPAGGALERLQWRFYRHVPENAPALAAVALAGSLALAAAFDPRLALALLAAVGLALATPVGRRLLRLLATIRAAVALESREPLGERWEMARR